ncbi:MAG: YHYH domain-containing protein [Clostridia bacterium]|nr:YHYH domain-containing protein [Clostridia bacterium]
MKKLKKLTTILLCTIFLLSLNTVSAHPGRLDSNGGHRKTSDGSYHYHLGSDRSVEYTSKPSGSTSSSSAVNTRSESTSYTPVKRNPKLYASDLNMFIKGKRIQTYSCTGGNPCYVIIAEDLEHYGFDTNWIAEWNTLYITRNDDKYAEGMSLANLYNGQYISDIYDSNIIIRLTFANGESYVPPAYSLNGRMIIPVDEMKCLGSFRYDSSSNTVYLD